jgi:ABC-type transport system involved in cytochrome c biogenesis permease component
LRIVDLHQLSSIFSGYFAGINSYLLFILMATAGVYAIASSFYQEEQQGTLDCLRLAPCKASTILMGKLLGAPVLVYLAGICALPLQLYTAQVAKISLLTILTWDLEIFGLLAIFYLGAAVLTLRFKTLPIVLAVSTGGLSCLLIIVKLISEPWSHPVQWYGISWTDPLLTFLAIAALAGIVIYWLYRVLERTYDRAATILSRRYSYLWSLNYHLFLLGLCLTHHNYDTGGIFGLSFDASLQTIQAMESGHPIYGDLPGLFWSLLSFWLLSIIPILLPKDGIFRSFAKQKFTKSSWLKMMLLEDRSPAILAVLVNLGIALTVWSIPVLLRLPTIETQDKAWTDGADIPYAVSSFGINYPSWVTIIFMVIFVWSSISPASFFRRVSNSPLWTICSFIMIFYPTVFWTLFRY